MDRVDVDAMRVFVKVAELGNLTRAAEHLGVNKSVVSRRLKALEAELGGRLFHRSTRVVRPTPDGEALLPRARRLVREADDIDALFRTGSSLRGRVRVDLPVHLGRKFIVPRLPELLDRHPDLELFLSSTDRLVEPVREGFDVVLRVGELADSDLIARRVGELTMVSCVSRGYAERYGVPERLEDLADHRVVHYGSDAEASAFEWADDRGWHERPVPSAITVNNADAYEAACMAGLGIIQVPRIGLVDRLASGELVEVLPEHRCPPMPVTLLHTHGRRPPRRVRALIGWIAEILGPKLG